MGRIKRGVGMAANPLGAHHADPNRRVPSGLAAFGAAGVLVRYEGAATADIRTDACCDHLLGYLLAEANARVVAFDDDVRSCMVPS